MQSDLAHHFKFDKKSYLVFFFSFFFFNFWHFLLGRKKIFSENFQMKFCDLHFTRFIFHLLNRHFMNGHLSTFMSFYIIYHQFRLNRPSKAYWPGKFRKHLKTVNNRSVPLGGRGNMTVFTFPDSYHRIDIELAPWETSIWAPKLCVCSS